MNRTILDLCGGTGSWSAPYREAGYRVVVVDPLAEGKADFKGTVREFVVSHAWREVRGILAAPPCDHFSVSGARWWPAKDADGRTAGAVQVVRDCLRAIEFFRPTWWALENPIGRIARLVPELGEPALRFDPCDYGDAYTKRTALWGTFAVPERKPVEPVMITKGGKRGSWMWANLGGKSARTKRLRSMTPPGFARAFFEANP